MITTRWVSSHLAPTLWGLRRRRRQDRRLTRVSISLIELTLGMINDHGSQHHYKSVKSVRHSADADINYTLLAGTLRTFPLECLSHHRYISHSDLNISENNNFPFSARYQKTTISHPQHHASKTTQMSGSAGYSVARVTETRKRMEIRGLNWSLLIALTQLINIDCFDSSDHW